MRFDNDCMSLWFGTPDASGPGDTVPAGAEIAITIAVHLGNRNNRVEVLYRVNKGLDETVRAPRLRLYQTDTGPAKGTWDVSGAASGSFGYQDIEDNCLASYTRGWHCEAKAPWLYSDATGIMISYADPQSLTLKADYVLSNKLGGVMIWELSTDDGQQALVNAIAAALGQATCFEVAMST
jgi:GH18 family chitinase